MPLANVFTSLPHSPLVARRAAQILYTVRLFPASGSWYNAERTNNRKMSIIEDLYNGKVCPIEDIRPKNEKCRPLANEIGDEREYFASKLPEEDKERFEKWNRFVLKYEGMVEYANFEYGFRLGSMLTLATFSEERDYKEIEEVQASEKDTVNLLDILADKRMETEIDAASLNDSNYQSCIKQQDKAFGQMDSLIKTLALNKQQKLIFNQAISANNAVGTAYGEIAYRLGFRDGIQFSSEIKRIK